MQVALWATSSSPARTRRPLSERTGTAAAKQLSLTTVTSSTPCTVVNDIDSGSFAGPPVSPVTAEPPETER